MFVIKRKHFKIISNIVLLLFLTNCQLNEPKKSHGINFLDNREKVLILNQTNKNDVIKLIGQPHSKSLNDENTWIYFERVITRGKLLKLGQNVLKTNNVLKLEFDKYGILKNKEILSKNDMKKVKYSKLETKNTVTQQGFINKFLSSVKQKLYGKQKF